MNNEKENPNDNKPKRISFENWVKSLELKTKTVPCEECDDGHNYCGQCDDGEVACINHKCRRGEWKDNRIINCSWCDDDGGCPDEYPGIESTGWVVCDHCHGDPYEQCNCDNDGMVVCLADGCWDGEIECEECEGTGKVIEYSPKNLEHLEELKICGICLFHAEGDICYHSCIREEFDATVKAEDAHLEDEG